MEIDQNVGKHMPYFEYVGLGVAVQPWVPVVVKKSILIFKIHGNPLGFSSISAGPGPM